MANSQRRGGVSLIVLGAVLLLVCSLLLLNSGGTRSNDDAIAAVAPRPHGATGVRPGTATLVGRHVQMFANEAVDKVRGGVQTKLAEFEPQMERAKILFGELRQQGQQRFEEVIKPAAKSYLERAYSSSREFLVDGVICGARAFVSGYVQKFTSAEFWWSTFFWSAFMFVAYRAVIALAQWLFMRWVNKQFGGAFNGGGLPGGGMRSASSSMLSNTSSVGGINANFNDSAAKFVNNIQGLDFAIPKSFGGTKQADLMQKLLDPIVIEKLMKLQQNDDPTLLKEYLADPTLGPILEEIADYTNRTKLRRKNMSPASSFFKDDMNAISSKSRSTNVMINSGQPVPTLWKNGGNALPPLNPSSSSSSTAAATTNSSVEDSKFDADLFAGDGNDVVVESGSDLADSSTFASLADKLEMGVGPASSGQSLTLDADGQSLIPEGGLGQNVEDLLGISAEQFNKLNETVGKNPEILEMLAKPGLLDKLMEIQKDPSKLIDSLNDPDIMQLQSKVVALLQNSDATV